MPDDEKPDKEARKRVAEWWDKPEHKQRPADAPLTDDLDDPAKQEKD